MSPLSPYRKLIGTLIGGVVTGLTWVIATNAAADDWHTWAQFALFLLPSVATFFSPPNADHPSPPALPGVLPTIALTASPPVIWQDVNPAPVVTVTPPVAPAAVVVAPPVADPVVVAP